MSKKHRRFDATDAIQGCTSERAIRNLDPGYGRFQIASPRRTAASHSGHPGQNRLHAKFVAGVIENTLGGLKNPEGCCKDGKSWRSPKRSAWVRSRASTNGDRRPAFAAVAQSPRRCQPRFRHHDVLRTRGNDGEASRCGRYHSRHPSRAAAAQASGRHSEAQARTCANAGTRMSGAPTPVASCLARSGRSVRSAPRPGRLSDDPPEDPREMGLVAEAVLLGDFSRA